MSIFTKRYPVIEHVVTSYGEYDRCDRTATPTIVESYKGATLCARELNYYDDSDGYSHVWDGEKVIRMGTWTTRAGTDFSHETIDIIGSEHEPAVRQWHIDWLMDRARAARSAQYDADLRANKRPAKGSKVRVTKGRKVPIGTEGTVIWVGPGYSKPWERITPPNRIGIKDESGTVHWTSESNAEVLQYTIPDPGDYPTDDEFLALFSSKDTLTLHSMYDANTSSLAFLR